MAKPRVLVDTCIIIAAFQSRVWTTLCDHFSVETVERCVEECQAGNPTRPGRIRIASGQLLQNLAAVHPVSEDALIDLRIDQPDLPALDAGELHLMAWLHANQPLDIALLISSSDAAAVRAAYVLGELDRTRSLEVLGRESGVPAKKLAQLEDHFKEPWLRELRTRIRLNMQ